MPKFLDRGFSGQYPDNWRQWLGKFIGKLARGLEIGCWDGRASVWFMENILTHEFSMLHVIDTFEGGEEHKAEKIDCSEIEKRFRENIAAHKSRVRIWVGKSSSALTNLATCEPFDFIYVDGSHKPGDVLSDSVLSWQILNSGGVLFWDDYEWTFGRGPLNEPHMAIDAFLACYEGQYKLLHKGYQVAVEKR